MPEAHRRRGARLDYGCGIGSLTEKLIGSVVAYNRSDCCQDRAVPLVIETSLDGQPWTQVAKRQKSFSRWKASIPKDRSPFRTPDGAQEDVPAPQ